MIDLPYTQDNPDFPPPCYETEGSVGFDLRADDNWVVGPCDQARVPTGMRVSVPGGYELQIRSRSGLASKGLVVANAPGTIDQDFRGEIEVILRNNTNRPWDIKEGDRIAQAVLCPVAKANFVKVDKIEPDTARGTGGFGSTGSK